MYGQYRTGIAQGDATINHFLATSLHLRVTTLHRGKIQFAVAGTAGDRGSRPATQAYQHGRTTQHHDIGSGRHSLFLDITGPDIAHAACDHDGFVITANFTDGFA